MNANLRIAPVSGRVDLAAFIDLPWAIYADDPHWVPPLKSEVRALLNEKVNPWFDHGHLQLFLARRGTEVVGRISAQVDQLALDYMAPGTGQWGLFEAKDAEVAAALIATAEEWLREEGMTRALGPVSISIWDEPGLLIEGFAEDPVVMMGHHRPAYEAWIEAAGYGKAKDLYTYKLDITQTLPPVVDRLVAMADKNERIHIRDADKSKFDSEAAIILGILNDAWSDNWGFLPLTDREIAYGAKKLKPLIVEEWTKIVEVDGEPAAFMITIPDANELIKDLDGSLLPFGWAKLLWRLRKPWTRRVRVPLMGVRKQYQGGRMASMLAFQMIEHTRALCRARGIEWGEIGWVLEDNQGMVSIAEIADSHRNHVYRIYEKAL